MDDYLNVYEYVGDEQSTATNVNKEEHEMVKITPQEAYKQMQYSTNTRALKATRKCLILMAVLIAVILFISLAAFVLSAVNFYNNTSNSKMVDLKTQGANVSKILDTLNTDTEFKLMQLNNTLLQLLGVQNVTRLSVIQSKMDISQLILQLDTINRLPIIVQARVTILHCGTGEWYHVAYLNMNDSLQQCPSAWREFTSDGIRVCARPASTERGCSGTLYPVGRQYSKVCGRVIGYQFGSTDAFYSGQQLTIDDAYMDGISITHGIPRTHIWSYAAGASENGSCFQIKCPCSNGSRASPSYVGNNYYCESAYQGDCWTVNRFFPGDPLWDGQQCDNEGTCCTGTNTPPWFNVELSNSTSDDIEVRICHDQNYHDEDSLIQLLEIYVQ